jgi:hypothetical protein
MQIVAPIPLTNRELSPTGGGKRLITLACRCHIPTVRHAYHRLTQIGSAASGAGRPTTCGTLRRRRHRTTRFVGAAGTSAGVCP